MVIPSFPRPTLLALGTKTPPPPPQTWALRRALMGASALGAIVGDWRSRRPLGS